MVQPLGIEIGDTPSEDLRFPGIRGRLETLDLANRFERAPFAEKLRARGNMLPAKLSVHELRRGNGLDFLSELSERQPVDAREQSAFTPFGLLRGRIGELAAQHNASSLKLQQSLLYVQDRKGEEAPHLVRGDRTQVSDPPRYEGQKGILAGNRW